MFTIRPFPQATETTPVVASPLCCIECSRAWERPSERWRLKVLVEDGETETVPYCPACYAREFEQD